MTFYIKPDIGEGSNFILDFPKVLLVNFTWLNFAHNFLKIWNFFIINFIPEAPARVGLGITTLLTIVSINYGLNRGFPPVSYPKAVDVWNFVCFFFVFCVMVEYVIVSVRYFSKIRNSRCFRLPSIFIYITGVKQKWLRGRIFGDGDFLSWARSKNPQDEKFGIFTAEKFPITGRPFWKLVLTQKKISRTR